MKSRISFLILFTLIIVLPNTSCNTVALADVSDLKSAKLSMPTAVSEIAYAQKETYSQFQIFVKEANTQIVKNGNSIREIKNKFSSSIKNSNDFTILKIDKLAKRNATFKVKLDNYILSGNGNWQEFKTDLDNDLTAFEIEFKNI